MGNEQLAHRKLRAQIIRDEGAGLKRDGRFFPYLDRVGKWTIGHGRNLSDVGISKEEAGILLSTDLFNAIVSVKEALPWVTTLNEPRQAVLYNMAFNMGIWGLLTFKKLLTILSGDPYHASECATLVHPEHTPPCDCGAPVSRYHDAAHEMFQSKWAGQVGMRAIRLVNQMETGEWVD